MMRIFKICCDLCGKEITNEKQYKYPILNTMACMEDGTIEIDHKDLCENCLFDLSVMFNNKKYATIKGE